MRIKKRFEYRSLLRKSLRMQGTFFLLDVQFTNGTNSKLGITVPSRFGHAPERNRFKRIARAAFLEIYDTLPQGCVVHLFPKQKAKCATSHQIAQEISFLVHEAQ